MDNILQQRGLQQFTEADVRHVVEENDKQRFLLVVDPESSRLKIRANQGHSVKVSSDFEHYDAKHCKYWRVEICS